MTLARVDSRPPTGRDLVLSNAIVAGPSNFICAAGIPRERRTESSGATTAAACGNPFFTINHYKQLHIAFHVRVRPVDLFNKHITAEAFDGATANRPKTRPPLPPPPPRVAGASRPAASFSAFRMQTHLNFIG